MTLLKFTELFIWFIQWLIRRKEMKKMYKSTKKVINPTKQDIRVSMGILTNAILESVSCFQYKYDGFYISKINITHMFNENHKGRIDTRIDCDLVKLDEEKIYSDPTNTNNTIN